METGTIITGPAGTGRHGLVIDTGTRTTADCTNRT